MKIHVWLNEREITREIAADLPLLEFVRSEGCYSVKRGCETSNCGLCTVWIDHKPVLSCSTLAARADGKKIVTLEGMQEEAKELGNFIANEGAEQCGFCNPGFIMNIFAMLKEIADPTEEQIKEEMLKEMARFKVPERILFLDAIPKTPGLKTDKKYIRTLFQ